MSTPDQSPTMWERSTTRRFLNWLFSRSTLQKLLFAAVVLLTLLVVLITIYNITGKRRLERVTASLKAQGEQMDPAAFIPPPVPDDQNFASTPFLAPLLQFQPATPGESRRWQDTNAFNRTANYLKNLPDITNPTWMRGERIDLQAWVAKYNSRLKTLATTNPTTDRAEAAKAVLEITQQFDPVVNELREASRRPHSRFNLTYNDEDPWSMLLPHLAVLRNFSRLAAVRASAFLELKQTQAAFQELVLMFALADSIKPEPIIISPLVRAAILQLAIQVTWEGLAKGAWTSEQLLELQNRFGQVRPIGEIANAVRSERAFMVKYLKLHRDNPARRGYLLAALNQGSMTGSAQGFAARFVPRGWFSRETCSFVLLIQELLEPYDSQTSVIDPVEAERAQKHFKKTTGPALDLIWHHRLISRIMIPAMENLGRRSSHMQSVATQAALACALERYRNDKGKFPQTLEELVPGFMEQIPHDSIKGQTFRYVLNSNGSYTLYSVGWNLVDDGGKPAFNSAKSNQVAYSEGDWVWRL